MAPFQLNCFMALQLDHPCSGCIYVWFTPLLDIYRQNRAMHGNTPRSQSPPLVPPAAPSPPEAHFKHGLEGGERERGQVGSMTDKRGA